jgi:hypothetical protein
MNISHWFRVSWFYFLCVKSAFEQSLVFFSECNNSTRDRKRLALRRSIQSIAITKGIHRARQLFVPYQELTYIAGQWWRKVGAYKLTSGKAHKQATAIPMTDNTSFSSCLRPHIARKFVIDKRISGACYSISLCKRISAIALSQRFTIPQKANFSPELAVAEEGEFNGSIRSLRSGHRTC